MEILLVILGVLLDRLSKLWALKTLAGGKDIVIINNFFDFQFLTNKGAAFGIFQNKLIFLSVLTFVTVGAMIYYVIKHKPRSKVLRVGIALIIGGALGNLYDRIVYKYVVDFILLHYKDVYYYPTFNVADILVVVGTLILAICIVKEEF